MAPEDGTRSSAQCMLRQEVHGVWIEVGDGGIVVRQDIDLAWLAV